ncbi:diguanylate cyclase [Microvirga sp. 2MCAF38]|uniref:sensor domain-containing diguanylate cyclase n=1 Tax=Microvirga sp. 2MCAF38 TaxID=3232989 RepID=UPI003F94385B
MISRVSRPSAVLKWSVPGTLLNLIATVIALSIFALFIEALWEARRDTWREAEQSSKNLLTAIARDIGGNIELLDLSIQGVMRGLNYEGFDKLPHKIQHLILFDGVAVTTYMGSIVILNEHGDIVADAFSLSPRPGNFADHDYFSVHKQGEDVGLYISKPYRSHLRGDDVSFAVSRRISNSDGSFGGVVIGAVSLTNLQQAMANIQLGENGTISLVRKDGAMLLRHPSQEENLNRDFGKSENFQRILREGAGTFDGVSVVDGVHRIYTFGPVASLPLFLTVAVSYDEVFSTWWRKAMSLSIITLLLCTSVVTLTFLFQRELRRRRTAEAELAKLALTDGLTSLPNRRAFDEALAREWSEALRTGRSLSLLFIDADFFKGFNDHYGHGKGDNLLISIARVLTEALKRPRDYAARYGGEEFTVLLPETDEANAILVAERIREAVMKLDIKHAVSAHDVVTISVGVGSVIPISGQKADSLLNAADSALYQAKALGRNRVSLA